MRFATTDNCLQSGLVIIRRVLHSRLLPRRLFKRACTYVWQCGRWSGRRSWCLCQVRFFVKFLNNHEIKTKITNRFKTLKSVDNVTVGFVYDVHEQHNAKASGIVKHKIIEIIIAIAIIALEWSFQRWLLCRWFEPCSNHNTTSRKRRQEWRSCLCHLLGKIKRGRQFRAARAAAFLCRVLCAWIEIERFFGIFRNLNNLKI